VLFEHNVEYLIWKRLADLETRPLHRALFEIEWRKLRRREAEACRRASLTIAVSEDDRRRLARLAPGSRTASVATGVDTSYFVQNGYRQRPSTMVFCGSMDWHPNEDAVLYFTDAILPRIRAEMPDATLTVVGRNPSDRLREVASRSGIVVTGTVDDVRPAVGEAAVYVVPLRAGGGTRLKIFEALSMSKAVVSTTVGAEGLGLESGRHFIAADEPDHFAREVVGLLRDPQRRRRLGDAGRRLMEARYAWDIVARDFEQRCAELVSGRTVAPELEPALVGRAFTARQGAA
jgi:glycosyltransferase involved in cell wall biosynthesis